jgi:hypothetical protein
MDELEIKSKISHLESLLVGLHEGLRIVRESNFKKVTRFSERKNQVKEVSVAIAALHNEIMIMEESFNLEINDYQNEIIKLRDELELKSDTKRLEIIEKRLLILKKPLKTPKYFEFDRLELQNLLSVSNPNRNRQFSRREIGLILKSKNDLRVEVFPYSLRVLRVVFALSLDLNDIRDCYAKFERKDKLSQVPFFDSEVRLFARDLQGLLCTEIGNKNPKYSLENLKKANFDNTTFHTFVMEHRQNGVVSALQKFGTLFEVEENIKEYIPNFNFQDSGVIKYTPPASIEV